MGGFVVDAQGSGGPAGGGEEVEGDPGEDLVGGPRVGVGPVVELFVDPGEAGDGAVGEGVGGRLGLGALEVAVAAALGREPVGAGQAGPFGGAVGRQGVLEREGGRSGKGRRVGGSDVVDVAGCEGFHYLVSRGVLFIREPNNKSG